MSWREYFIFTKKERTAIIVISTAVIILNLLPFFFPQNSAPIRISQLEDGAQEWLREKSFEREHTETGNERPVQGKSTLFEFDPNTISFDEWLKLGLREKTIKTILNFISKGGKFRVAEDLGKIYGLSEKDLDRLLPFVRIKIPNYQVTNRKYLTADTLYPKRSHRVSKTIDINEGDTTAFIELPGIGSKLALRIITFREKLGGFYSVYQIREVYGLADSVFVRIQSHLICDSSNVVKINLNTIGLPQLQQHPYIGKKLGPVIIQYRNQHGSFSSVDELRKIDAIDDQIFQKLLPYLTL